MDTTDTQANAYFTQPFRQFAIMLIVLALVGYGGYVAYPRVETVFFANPQLNGFIGLIFVIGVVACFWQVISLVTSVSWIEGFALDRPGHELVKAPRLLAPLAALLRSRGARMHINSTSARSILDSVATRVDEARDITRYITNLLIFLGLLGTFFGLATTVPALVETIKSLTVQEGETGVEIFGRLQAGLEAQLDGMGVAFGSSLLGLAGSLVVGLLELFAGHGQNRFYRELEEWLSTITRIGLASGEGDGESTGGGDAGAMALIAEQFAEQMEGLGAMAAQSDVVRAQSDEKLGTLTRSIAKMVEMMDVAKTSADPEAFDRVAAGQEQLVAILKEQAEAGAMPGHVDAESRMRLRSIDVQLLRLLEEMTAGRQESTADLRADISALTKAVRHLADAQEAGR